MAAPLRTLAWWAAAGVAYFVAGRIGLETAFVQDNVTPVWPAAGLAAAVLFVRPRIWPGILAGSIAVNLSTGLPVRVGVVMAFGNVAAAIVAGAIARRCGYDRRIRRSRDVAKLALISFAPPLIAATWGTFALATLLGLGDAPPLEVWATWWMGDSLGTALVLPLLTVGLRAPRGRSLVETFGLTAVLAGATAAVFMVDRPGPDRWALVVPMIWVATRYGAPGTVLATNIISVSTAVATVSGRGPYWDLEMNAALLQLDVFVGALTFAALTLAVVASERDAANESLRDLNDNLLRAVEGATADLKAEKHRTQRVLATAHDAYVELDAELRVVEWNNRAAEIFGWDRSEIVGHPFVSFIARAENLALFADTMAAVRASEDGVSLEVDAQRADGSPLPAEVTVWCTHNGHVATHMFIRDITERRTAQAIVAARQAQNEQIACRQAALAELAAQALVTKDRAAFEAAANRTLATVLGDHPVADDADSSFVAAVEHFSSLVRQRCDAELALQVQALYDPLTGLPNRSLLEDRLVRALQRCERTERLVGVLFIDVDRFKVVNDSLGHVVGDELLCAIGDRFRTAIRTGDTLARFGGDEFVVICEDLGHEWEINAITSRIRTALEQPVTVGDRVIEVTASIGVAFGRSSAVPPEDLLRDADAAMYRAKDSGRNRAEVFDEEMRRRALHRLDMEQSLRRALEASELEVHFQPVVNLVTKEVKGVEALVRWEHSEHGRVPPLELVTLAEETGLIVSLTDFVLDKACAQLAAWRRAADHLGELTMSVNLSGHDLSETDVVERVTGVLRRHDLPPSALTIEITETALVDDETTAGLALQSLHDAGVRIAVDDFGTGYSSLAYLRRFPVDVVKLDRLFVAGVVDDESDAAIVRGVIALAESLGLATVAEGIERPDQAAELSHLQCTYGQGFLYCRPQPATLLTPVFLRGLQIGNLAALEPAHPRAATSHEVEPAQSPKRRVFLVDDSDSDRALTRELLEQTGRFEIVGEADSGADALVRTSALAPDIVLVDMSMPGMDGLEVVSRLRRLLPNSHIAVLSGYVSSGVSQQARAVGAVACVEKDERGDRLVEQLLTLAAV